MNTPRICIDPGVTKGHYWAAGSSYIIDAGKHDETCLLTGYATRGEYWGCAYVEIPTINFDGKPDKNILDLRGSAERAVAWWYVHSFDGSSAAPECIPAQTWKAGDKNAHQFAIWRALTPAEQDVLLKLAPRSTRDSVTETLSRRCVNGTKSEYAFGNAIDAAGIFLYTGGRVDKFGRSR